MKNSCKNIERIIMNLVNKERKKYKLVEFKSNYGLIHLSRNHSRAMARKGKIWHGENVYYASKYLSFGESKFIKFLSLFFNFNRGCSGENVAMMSRGNVKGFKKPIKSDHDIASALHKSWMNSPGHRKNILNKNFDKLGIGVKNKGNGFYATQVFYG